MYSYDYVDSASAGLSVMLIFMVLLAGLAIVACIVGYILQSLAFKKGLIALGYSNPNVAWIPFYNLYVMSDCLPDDGNGNVIIFNNFKIQKSYFKFWWLLGIIVCFVPFIGSLASIVVMTVGYGTCFMYINSIIDRKPISDVMIVSYIFGFFIIIEIFKLLFAKIDSSNIAQVNMDSNTMYNNSKFENNADFGSVDFGDETSDTDFKSTSYEAETNDTDVDLF